MSSARRRKKSSTITEKNKKNPTCSKKELVGLFSCNCVRLDVYCYNIYKLHNNSLGGIMRRREAKAAGDAAYIKWLEDRLSFLRLLVCALLAFSVLSAATLGVVLSEQEKPPVTRSAEVYSYFTPKPTMMPGGNPLEKYAQTNQKKTVYVSKSGAQHILPETLFCRRIR